MSKCSAYERSSSSKTFEACYTSDCPSAGCTTHDAKAFSITYARQEKECVRYLASWKMLPEFYNQCYYSVTSTDVDPTCDIFQPLVHCACLKPSGGFDTIYASTYTTETRVSFKVSYSEDSSASTPIPDEKQMFPRYLTPSHQMLAGRLWSSGDENERQPFASMQAPQCSYQGRCQSTTVKQNARCFNRDEYLREPFGIDPVFSVDTALHSAFHSKYNLNIADFYNVSDPDQVHGNSPYGFHYGEQVEGPPCGSIHGSPQRGHRKCCSAP